MVETTDAQGRHFEITIAPIDTVESSAPNDYSVVLRDITTRKRAEQRLRLAMDEMKHRVKNTLAVVSGIARQTLPTSFRDAFIGRLHALSRAQDVLTDDDQKKADLIELLEATAAKAGGPDRFRITGHSATLPPEQGQSLSMALHELATNALKYGALSHPDGYVQVECEMNDDMLRLVWHERDGPPVLPPTHRGFGTKMISDLLQVDLQARVDVDYRPDGLRCEIAFRV
ncbi:MAG TPA: sensor histidine kinase [Marinobacter sp.]|nr:sensor histidine kinase [Marinobacter sp.]